jgi:hypothetical protein
LKNWPNVFALADEAHQIPYFGCVCARGAALDAIKAAFLRCVSAGSNQISPNFIRLLPKFLSGASGPLTGGPELT